MRPLRYSINITLDGCCDHRAGQTDEELHRYWAEKFAQADALIFGRVTYGMMEGAWRLPATGVMPDGMADWVKPFARTIDPAKKYVVSSTLDRVDWNAELLLGKPGRGDLGRGDPGAGRSATQAGTGQRIVRGRRDASAVARGAGIDR